MRKQSKQLDEIIRQCVSSYLINQPILYLLTDDADIVDQVIKDQSMVELFRWKGEEHAARPERIPHGQIDKYLEFINGDQVEEKIEEKTIKWKKNVRVYYPGEIIDPLSHIKKIGLNVPAVMAVKGYGLALDCDGKGGKTIESNIQRYISNYMVAKKESLIRKSVLILASSELRIPKEWGRYVTVVEPEYLRVWEIKEILDRIFRERNEHLSHSYREELADRLKGFSVRQIEATLERTSYEAGYLSSNKYTVGRRKEERPEQVAFSIINSEKKQMLKQGGVLEYQRVDLEPRVGGMEELMKYLEEKCHFFLSHRLYFKNSKNIDFPKGILISGIPGSGKSLMAKKISYILNVPLIRLDMANIIKSFLGQSAEQMKKAFRMAEAMAPCVLWIDEVEKAFSGVGGRGSDSASAEVMRCFGLFLTWMQEQGEKKRQDEDPPSPCFIFATANDVGDLPPEFLRSGRFDRKYYTFMPTEEECISIFKADMENLDSITDENGNKICLFDTSSMDAHFWKNIMDYCVKDGKNKFITGSDIHAINQEALRWLVISEYSGQDRKDYENMDASERYRILERNFAGKKQEHRQYGSREWERALKYAIDNYRTYGETNMGKIAECYVALRENNFSPVSDEKEVLIPFSQYRENQEEPLDASENRAEMLHRTSRYNQQMYCQIGKAVNQLTKELKRSSKV